MKTNPNLVRLIRELRKLGNKEKANIWKRIADELDRPTRRMREVNVWKINKITKANDMIIVPGKVLGDGELDHNVSVAAYQFSDGAKAKIKNHMLIEELMEKHPKGNKLRIIG